MGTRVLSLSLLFEAIASLAGGHPVTNSAASSYSVISPLPPSLTFILAGNNPTLTLHPGPSSTVVTPLPADFFLRQVAVTSQLLLWRSVLSSWSRTSSTTLRGSSSQTRTPGRRLSAVSGPDHAWIYAGALRRASAVRRAWQRARTWSAYGNSPAVRGLQNGGGKCSSLVRRRYQRRVRCHRGRHKLRRRVDTGTSKIQSA